MKLKNLFLIGVALLTVPAMSFGGHNETKRNGCWFLNKRFKIDAHVTLGFLFPVCLKRGGDCDYVSGYCSNYGACGATAWSHAGWDGLYGGQHACGGYKAGINPDIIQDLSFTEEQPANSSSDNGYGDESNFVHVDFADNVVQLSSIQMSMFSSPDLEGEHTYTLTVWAPKDDEEQKVEDDEINEDEILYQTKVTISNGEVSVAGNLLNPSDFVIENTGEGASVQYTGGDVSVVVPDAYNGAVIAVTSGADLKPNDAAEVALIHKTLDLSAFSQSINVYPNPANDQLTIRGSWDDQAALEYGVYDITGKSVISKDSKAAGRGESFQIDISRLAPGNYYLMIKSGTHRSVKSFVKQ